ncbi:MAG TPA: glycosyltransferase family 61 protein [Dongiaceae bacterium]|jgi:capsular polysaccharide biosynthesis protein|nr:glycosyltransferase family 61 protein [Dongiaceae bacterium]
MAESAPLPAPSRDMIQRLKNATVTRARVDRAGRFYLGAVYDSGGALAAASLRATDKYRSRNPDTLVEELAGRRVEQRLPRAIYLGHAFTHFGHFLLETISALYWVREVDAQMPLLFHPFDEGGANVFTDRPHGIECLKLLGISPDRIVMATRDIAVDELLLPPRAYEMRAGPRYDFRDVYRSLRDAVLYPPAGKQAARVYFSRRGLKRRQRSRLANEAAIERRIAARGFTVLHPERMSFSDQIRAAASADIIAGVDGSALHLAAFTRPGARMLVLETKRRRNITHVNTLMEVETIAVPAVGPRPPSIDSARLDAALDDLGCPQPAGAIRRILDHLFR